MKHIPLIVGTLLWTPAPFLAQTQKPECPERGVNPSTFCPYGSVCSKKDKNVSE